MGGEGGAVEIDRRDDRERWNARYRAGDGPGAVPALLRTELDLLPARGRALDVAGGSGAAAVVLAQRGLDVTLADVSEVALEQAAERAAAAGVSLTTVAADLVAEPFPAGPWDLITCFDYLDRALFPTLAGGLARGGVLAVSVATRSNLQRHPRPSARFLLDDGELPSLLGELELLLHRQGWNLDGRHVADVIARRP